MVRLVPTFALLIALAACSEAVPPLTVTAIPAPPPPPFRGVLREISEFHGGPSRNYEVTVPSDGTLVGRLTWQQPYPPSTQLALTLGDGYFAAVSQDLSVVGRIIASAGNTYRVKVDLIAEDYWEGGSARFVLILSLE